MNVDQVWLPLFDQRDAPVEIALLIAEERLILRLPEREDRVFEIYPALVAEPGYP